MPILQPDFAEALELGAIDPGTYPAKVLKFELGKSKKGDPMLIGDIELMVAGKPRNRRVWWLTSGKGSGSLKQYLRAVGLEKYTEAGTSFDSDDIVNLDFLAVIEADEYNGQKTDRIQNCLKA